MVIAPEYPEFPPPGFLEVVPVIYEHPQLIWRNRNQGTPSSRDDDFIRSIRHISMKKSQRHPTTGMLPEVVHQARVMNEMKETLGSVFLIFDLVGFKLYS